MKARVTEFRLTRTQTIWVRVEVPDPKDDDAAASALAKVSDTLWREYDACEDEDWPVALGTVEHNLGDGNDIADLTFGDGEITEWEAPAIAPDARHAFYIDGVKWATCGCAVVRMDTAVRRTYWRTPGNPSVEQIAGLLRAPRVERIDLPPATERRGELIHALPGANFGLDPDLLVDMRDGDSVWRGNAAPGTPAFFVVRGDEVVAVVAPKQLDGEPS